MNYTPENLMKWKEQVHSCMEKKDLLTVFQLDANDKVNQLDVAILQSLLQGNSVTPKRIKEILVHITVHF